MRVHILHQDTSLAIYTEEYKRNRTTEGPLTEAELAEIWTGYNEELEQTVPRRIPLMIAEIQSAERAAARSHREIKVAAGVEQRWGAAFRHLQHLIGAVEELARRFIIRLEETPDEHVGSIHVARTVLITRAIQTALGAETLLRAGHCAAAWAQWRTLHELAVVALFVNKHGDAVAAAYMQHGIEQSYRTLKAIQTHHKSIADDPKLAELLKAYSGWKKMLESPEMYGSGFGATYGWAGAVLGKSRPDFTDLEADVKMSVARAEYQRASNVVHPGVRGFLDHQPDDPAERASQPWQPHAALLGEPLALTAKTLTALIGGIVDVSSAASDYVLLGTISHFRDEVLATVYPRRTEHGTEHSP
ncbi:DUF5677 domain-containing protein [Longimicrobium terrae]|uniref:Uncharacterized protein n=1 Tax=Longimicrobium terrae TaxID=1639882 RepID=A0A841GR30_9BACT|nr:DUF5677 domain-containing protein [Longimicrobium terrae]MBB4635628.1 hypothetical protein [Longimicrobium terrae]MBB6070022.1 hypothetical protein [Longimicrobium terrae]NNC32930.1 hypothetical protein [Longimicrobium terrae]